MEKQIAILGSGPSGLFMFKRIVEEGPNNISVTVYERKEQLGAGMPYSSEGANPEHITNVSDNEIPAIVCPVEDWVKSVPEDRLQKFGIDPHNFNEYKVLPRLLFGQYLSAQFDLLLGMAKEKGMVVRVLTNTTVIDIIDKPAEGKTAVRTTAETKNFDAVIICTGHNWPCPNEKQVPRYFDSPYPPAKLAIKTNYPVAIRGSSLTAIDAVRTLARQNGTFVYKEGGIPSYQLNEDSRDFKLVMHSLNGLLPAIRFHLDDSHLSKDSVPPADEVFAVMEGHGGFVPLDYLFERNFKAPIRQQDTDFYEEIKDMRLEEFVEKMMSLRERLDAFTLFKAEYAEAEKSIKRHQSVYWKEMLAVLSFAMNYPAKHLSAEDMLRLQKVLMPLISIVIAFVPQSSAREMLALYEAGVLSLVSVDRGSSVVPEEKGGATYQHTDENGRQQKRYYSMFIDCIGQPRLALEDLPFSSLVKDKIVSQALLKFKSATEGQKEIYDGNKKVQQAANGDYYLQVSGISINDNFQVTDSYGAYNKRIYMMAVPYMGGYNPDYSGLDFCEAASARIITAMIAEE